MEKDFKTLLRKIVIQRILLSVEEGNFHHGKIDTITKNIWRIQ